MTKIKTIGLLLPFTFLLYGCPEQPPQIDIIASHTTVVPRNIIGFVGEASENPYIEVEYTVKKLGENTISKKLVSPPYVVGGEDVIVSYDSVNFVSGNHIMTSYRKIKPDYSPLGSHYLKITNRSNKPIEYFIASTTPLTFEKEVSVEKMKTPEGYNRNRIIKGAPSPVYNYAPIYYLLFPNKRPLEDAFIRNVTKWEWNGTLLTIKEISVKRICFVGNRCGDEVVQEPITVEQAMALYRNEYAASPNVKLYGDYYDIGPGPDLRLKDRWKDSYVNGKRKILYGTIAPGQQLINTGDIWVIPSSFQDISSDVF